MSVLEAFSPERQRLNTTQVAARTGLSRAAARRQLLTLQALGYLDGAEGHYWLSPKVLRLAGAYLSSSRLPRVLQPALDRLALQTRRACSAVLLDRAQVVIVARSVPDPALVRSAYGLHQGARLAAHATSTGRMLLAGLPAADLKAWLRTHAPLARLTQHTVTEPGALASLIAEARRDDCCLCSEEHELGLVAVAVPLRDLTGRTVAAVNLVATTGPAARRSLERELPSLRSLAREVQPYL